MCCLVFVKKSFRKDGCSLGGKGGGGDKYEGEGCLGFGEKDDEVGIGDLVVEVV